MKKKINKKKFSASGGIQGAQLTGMRDIAYGHDMQMHIYKTIDRSERMRDDDDLLAKAEAKRERKKQRALKGL